MSRQNYNVKAYKITNRIALEKVEQEWRDCENTMEFMAWAKNDTSYAEICEKIIRDKDGPWKNPVYLYITRHKTSTGTKELCRLANEFYKTEQQFNPMDILSISAGLKDEALVLRFLVRPYEDAPDISGFFDYVGDELVQSDEEIVRTGTLIIPDEIKNFHYTEEEIRQHEIEYKHQQEELEKATEEIPFLNRIDKYVPKTLPRPEEKMDLIYDLKSKEQNISIISSYEQYNKVFREMMIFVNGVEYYHYVNVISGKEKISDFMDFLEHECRKKYVDNHELAAEDVPAMMEKLYRSLFQLYIVQDLIDDPNVTDIKITAPDAIRARVKGKAYISNISFIDREDYLRFVNGIAVRNGISQNVPSQTFTDSYDEEYILRFSITAEYVNSVPWPYLHIRKVARKKLMDEELINAGMFDEKVRDYLLDCGRNSRGVVFAGPPGSGKTVCLNWFLEAAYEQSAEILVIQENDELFAYRKGVMFEHVVNYATRGKKTVSLEELGQLALVAGANVFIIGEAKGAEICSAITLSNSGCRTAITIHSPSSTETVDKMADLAMRGYAQNYEQAKRMLKSFQTIVYLENFSVKEISEIIGYDEKNHDMIYRHIYRKEEV